MAKQIKQLVMRRRNGVWAGGVGMVGMGGREKGGGVMAVYNSTNPE